MFVPRHLLALVVALACALFTAASFPARGEAAVTFRSCNTANGSAFWPYTVSFSRPAGTQPGDLMIIHATVSAFYDAGGPPSGWTELLVDSSPSTFTWYRIAAAGDPASFTTEFMPATSTTRGVISTYTGNHPTAPIDGSARSSGSGTSVSIAGTGMVVPRAGDLRVSATSVSSGSTATYSGMTKQSCQQTSSPSMSVAWEAVSPGTLAARSASLSSSGSWASHTTLIRAAPAAPAITGIAPSSGPTTGGTVVSISGTDFSDATAVTFGGVAASSFSVVNAGLITATAPPGAGTQSIRVTTPLGTSPDTAADDYTYTVPACGGGGLTLSAPDVTFPAHVLDGADHVQPASTTLRISDLTGLGAGWNLQIGGTRFATAGGQLLPETAARITGVSATLAGGGCALPTPAFSDFPVTLPLSPAKATFYRAALGSGRGPIDLDVSLALTIPANAYLGTYLSEWVVDVASGP